MTKRTIYLLGVMAPIAGWLVLCVGDATVATEAESSPRSGERATHPGERAQRRLGERADRRREAMRFIHRRAVERGGEGARAAEDEVARARAGQQRQRERAAIRAQAWALGPEQTARRLAAADREHQRRHAVATSAAELDRLAQAISAAVDEDRRGALLRTFQRRVAATDSPARERRLAQLDALVAQR